jgi:hypothetical protein
VDQWKEICGLVYLRNLRICDCVSLRIFGFKKTVAWPPLKIYSGAWGKLIHEKKTWSQKSCDTIPLNFLLLVQNCTKWKPQIHPVFPCQLETITHDWIYLKVPPPPHTQVRKYILEWRGWISRAIPRKCSPLAQIRREKKSLVLFYLFTLWPDPSKNTFNEPANKLGADKGFTVLCTTLGCKSRYAGNGSDFTHLAE